MDKKISPKVNGQEDRLYSFGSRNSISLLIDHS